MQDLLNKISLWIVKQLDKLKMTNPILFVFVQAILVAIAGLLNSGSLVIPTPLFLEKYLLAFGIESINGLFTGLIVAVISLMGLHTSAFLKKNK